MEDADVDRRPGRGRARPGQRRLPRVRRGRQDDPRQRRDPARVLPARRPRASSSGSSCASSPRRSRSRATARSRRSSIGRNELVEEGGTLRAKDTGEREELECGLVLRSVGYTGIPIEGVPFDEKRGLILNEGGRVLDSHDSGHKVGHYTAGWIKRGPSGVIGTNKKDALETVQHLLADVESQTLLEPGEPRPGRGRGAARRARRPLRQLRGLAGDRPGRGRPRRAPRPPPGQVRPGRGDARARSARRSPASSCAMAADLGRAEGDDRGGAARRRRSRSIDEDRRRRPPAGDGRRRRPVRRASRGSTSTAWSRPRSGALRRRHDPCAPVPSRGTRTAAAHLRASRALVRGSQDRPAPLSRPRSTLRRRPIHALSIKTRVAD